MILSCEQCRELLALHVEHDVPADVASHLESCADCAALYATSTPNEYSILRAAVTELRALPPVAAPADLRERIRAQIAEEAAQNMAPARRAPRFSLPGFALPRFALPRPLVPRWATYALPPFAVATCLMLLLSREPDIARFSTAPADEKAPPATQNEAAATGGSATSNRNAKNPNSRRAQKTAPRPSSTRSSPEAPRDGAADSTKSNDSTANPNDASDAGIASDFAPPRAQTPAGDSSRATLPNVVPTPRAERNPAKTTAPRVAKNTVPRVSTTPVPAAATPADKSVATHARLFARLESVNETPVAPSRKALSRERGFSRSAARDDIAPETSRNAADAAQENADTAIESADEMALYQAPSQAPSQAPPSSSAQADGEAASLYRAPTNDAAPDAADNFNGDTARVMRAPVAPSIVAGATAAGATAAPTTISPIAPATAAQSTGEANATTSAELSAPKLLPAPPGVSRNAKVGRGDLESAPATSSTRSTRKATLSLILPKTSARLRVQIRWPGGAPQTVWSGRGTRGQKLRLDVSTHENNLPMKSRNKNARLQVSVQEAAPLLSSSRIVWNTIAREEIAIQ